MRVRLLGQPGVQGAACRGPRGHPRQQQPGDDHDRPGAGRSHLRRAAHTGGAGRHHRARASRCAAADGRRADRAEPGGRSARERHAREVQRRADRRVDSGDQGRRGPSVVQGRDARDRPRCAAERRRAIGGRSDRTWQDARVPARHPPVVHDGRHRRRHRLQRRRAPRSGRARHRAESGARNPDRGIGHRLEGIRARGDARLRRQLRRHLLDREHRSDGRPHRRQHHRRADSDAQRQGISADARRGAADHPPGRRRNRRLEHPVRGQPGQRPDDR